MSSGNGRKVFANLPRLLGVAVFLLIWEIAPRLGLIDATFIPAFSTVMIAWFNLLISGELILHILASLQRSVLGFGLALALALPAGLLLGWFKRLEYYVDALLQTFRQTSILALFPVFILLFGIGEVSKIAIVFWGAAWPILLNTISGVKNIDPLLIKSARSMGASQVTIFLKVVLPASIPSILTGVRLSATFSIIVLTGAEMLGANAGLGFLVFDSQAKFRVPEMFAAILTMSLLGLVVNYSIVAIERRVARWKEDLPAGG
jgi:NitT/TauT family transport system permease protein